jgi:hypothetical protein
MVDIVSHHPMLAMMNIYSHYLNGHCTVVNVNYTENSVCPYPLPTVTHILTRR